MKDFVGGGGGLRLWLRCVCCDWSRCMTNQATLQTHAWKIVLCMAVSRPLLLVLCPLASGEV